MERSGPRSNMLASATLGAVPFAAAGLLLVAAWLSGVRLGSYETPIANLIQWSDARGYWTCANQWIDQGVNGPWCHRRPLYSIFLSGIALLTDRNLILVLIFQALLVGAAGWCFVRELKRSWGSTAAAVGGLFLFGYAAEIAAGVTMSEVLGVTLGCLAGAMLLSAARSGNHRSAGIGFFLFSAGMSVRPGAMFALPLLFAWMVSLGSNWGTRGRLAVWGLAAAAAGAFTTTLCLIAIHADLASANNNFAYVLYGLSVGKGWYSVVADHPELTGESIANYRALYHIAWQNIQHDPVQFLVSLLQNLWLFVGSIRGAHHAAAVLKLWLPATIAVTTGIYLLALTAAFVEARKSRAASLVLLAAIGEVISSAVVYRDGGLRIFAVSAALAQAGLLANLVRFFEARLIGPRIVPPPIAASLRRHPLSALILAGITGLMLVLPFTPLRRLEATPVEAVPPLCSGELQQAVVTVSRGGAVVTVDPSEGRFSWPGKIGLAKFVRDWTAVPAGTPMPLDLVIAFREGSVPSDHPSAFYLPHSAHMPLNARLVLCLDNAHHIDVGNFVFERVVTFAPRPLHG